MYPRLLPPSHFCAPRPNMPSEGHVMTINKRVFSAGQASPTARYFVHV